tara:strand:- start:1422 stop:1655 length:234 start_codon:yes stop_codon:yes gene_type:complete
MKKKTDVFYEITHRGRSAGFFKTRDAAHRCANEFKSEIEGGIYPVEIITREFLDYNYPSDDPEKDDFNWGPWDEGAV